MKAKMILAGAVLFILIASNAFVAYKCYNWGSSDKQAEWDKAVAKKTEKKIDTRTIQDEIQSAPLDGDITDRRLFDGTF